MIGHENLGRVVASGDPGLVAGDLVVGFVRCPDPVPCPACAAGERDMCRNGRYTTRGITGRHGFARERRRSSAGGLLRLDPTVRQNGVVFGTVNADRRHYEGAARSLAAADPAWLDWLVSRRVGVADWPDAFEHRPGDVKVQLTAA